MKTRSMIYSVHHFSKQIRSILLIIPLLFWFVPAWAQDTTSSGEEEFEQTHLLGTITVDGNSLYDMPSSEKTKGYSLGAATIGTKTPALLRDIPQSITVITNDYLQDRQYVNLDDMAKETPGLRVLTNDSGRSSIYSRGYEYDEFNIDGLPAPMTSSIGDLPTLSVFDRVEVMRGPSGLFNSTSELGGIINLVRKRPTAETQGTGIARYGSWGRYYLEAGMSGALNSDDSIRGRFLVSRANNPREWDYSKNISDAGNVGFDIDLGDSTVLSLGVIHQTKEMTPTNGLPADADGSLRDWDRDTFIGADWNEFCSRTTDAVIDLSHRFNNGAHGRIAMRSSQRKTDYHYAYAITGVADDGSVSLNQVAVDNEQNNLSMDISYSKPFSTFGQVSEFVVGIDHKNYQSDETYGSSWFFATIDVNDFDPEDVDDPGRNESGREKRNSQETGLYSKVTFRPIEHLALIAGGRVSSFQTDYENDDFDDDSYDDTNDQTLNGQSTPYAGLVWDIDESYAAYFSYSEVFKPQSETDEDGEYLAPRRGKQVEAGIKGSYLNEKLNSRLSVFQLVDENRATLVYDSNGNSLGYYEASAKHSVTGAEVELSGEVTPGWELLVGYTNMKTEKISGDENANFAVMPENQFAFWSKYSFGKGITESSGLDRLSLGFGVTSQTAFYYESTSRGVTTRIDAPGYTVVDAKVEYAFTQNLKVNLDINNLLDEKYYSRVGRLGMFNFYGPSRNLMAGVQYNF